MLILSRRARTEETGDSGFTVIEAVIALGLVAVMLASIGSLVATNALGVRNLGQHIALVETLRLVATGLPRAGEPLPEQLDGQIAGYRWQMRVSPFLDRDMLVAESRFVPARIELRVRSSSGAMMTLETVRLQSRDPR